MSHTGHPVSVRADGQTWRVILGPVRYQTKYYVPSEYGADNYAVADASQATAGVPGTLVVGRTLTGIGDRVSQLSAEELAIGAAVAALVIALTRRGMNSLAEVGGLARAVAQGQWSRRLPEHQGSTEMNGIAPVAEPGADPGGTGSPRPRGGAGGAGRGHPPNVGTADGETRQLHGPLSVITGVARQHPRRGALAPADAGRTMKRIAQEASQMADTIDTLSPAAPSDTQP